MLDQSIYGRLYKNGSQMKEVDADMIDKIAYFLNESLVIESIYKFQTFSSHPMDYITSIYK